MPMKDETRSQEAEGDRSSGEVEKRFWLSVCYCNKHVRFTAADVLLCACSCLASDGASCHVRTWQRNRDHEKRKLTK